MSKLLRNQFDMIDKKCYKWKKSESLHEQKNMDKEYFTLKM